MHALVTGGAGFIGSALVERLLAESHTVDVVDNLSSGSLWNLADARAGSGRDLTFHQLDLRSPDVAELIQRRRPEVIWHLAANSGSELVTAAEVDIVGALSVLDGAQKAGTAKIVVASSAAVYGDLVGRQAATESSGRQPSSAAAIAKHTVDSYLAACAPSFGVAFTSLVLGSVYGPRSSTGVVASWAECFAAGRQCTVFGSGEQVRDFVFVDDVVDALARAADRADGMFVNVATGIGTSLSALHAAMAGLAGSDAELRRVEARRGDRGRVVLDVSRAAEVLEWKPWTPLAVGLATVCGPAES